MEKKQIVNIINFVRGVNPRCPEMDNAEAIREQIKLMKEHSLKGTFLLQYDALVKPEYYELFTGLDPEQFEIGLWYEIVQPLVESCGYKWRGRFPWDWYPCVGFSVGYTKEEREKLITAAFERFKSVFGHYPKVFGSWFFDSYTARIIADRYEVDAFCNCREQYGTDGYTLWGGYYGQGYYPGRNNIFMPAQTKDEQINIPIFRMLGPDPVYQYDFKLDPNREEAGVQSVITLEPVYCGEGGGGNKQWVDWFVKENYNGDCLSFGYAQAGQENGFGWQKMKNGISYQFPLFAKLRDDGKIQVEQLGETGRWYKQNYSQTPPSAIVAHSAFDDEDKTSVWYCTKKYRINLYADKDGVRIRDIHIFSQKHADPYENELCTIPHSIYDTLPFIDGNRNTGRGVVAGGYIKYTDESEINFEKMKFYDMGDGCATVKYGDISIELSENTVKILAPKPFTLERRVGIDGGHLARTENVGRNKIDFSYKEVEFSVVLENGSILNDRLYASEANMLIMKFID